MRLLEFSLALLLTTVWCFVSFRYACAKMGLAYLLMEQLANP